MALRIENNIPIPPARGFGSGATNPIVKDLTQMQPGQSAVIQGYGGKKIGQFLNGARYHLKRSGQDAKFAQRKLQDGSVRVWRTQ